MTIPGELARGGPRHVTLTAGAWRSLAGAVANIVLIVVFFVWQGGTSRHPSATASFFWWGWRASATLLVAAAIGLTRIQRQRRILMYGRATAGQITGEVTPWWRRLRKRRRRPRRLQCEFLLLNGRTCRTTVDTRDKVPVRGEEAVIVYDPDEPEKAVLYPAWLLKVEKIG